MTTPPIPSLAGNRFPIMRARRRASLIIALLALILVGTSLAATLYFVQSDGDSFWTSDNAPAPAPFRGKYGLAASTFANIPINEAGQDVAAAVEETSSDARVLEQLSADQARARNAEIRAAADVGPAAQPLKVPLGDGMEFIRALDCMTTAIYYEAANEPLDGQRAVAQVIVNRSRHAVYPHSICAVVYQGWQRKTGCQFSFTCDGSLRRPPVPALWMRARRVANMALSGLTYAPVGLATHYHADYVLPYWAPTLVKQTVIGRHIFYRWPGAWGTPRSFVAAYDAHEPDIWAEMQTAGIAGPSAVGEDVGTALPADTSARPVLMTDTLTVTEPPTAGQPAAEQPKDRVYLMSRNGSAPAPKTPTSSGRGVTGGAIMPGTATVPTAPLAKLPQDTGLAGPAAMPPQTQLQRN